MATADGPVLQLPAKDVMALLRLLEGFEALLREGTLDDGDQTLATGGIDLEGMAAGPWRARMAAEVAVACGVLRQSLEGEAFGAQG